MTRDEASAATILRSPFDLGTPWPSLSAGASLTVLKRDPSGAVVTQYPGTVVDVGAPAPWLAIEATWVNRVVELDGLRFLPGDRLIEYFSPDHPYNVFAVFSPEGMLRGWYANVTYPTLLDLGTEPPELCWHDLFLDVVALPAGSIVLRDEDELAESGVEASDPALDALIRAAAAELCQLAEDRQFPFHDRDRDL